VAQSACSPKESWGPTRVVIYQGKGLQGLHHLLSESRAFAVVPYHPSLDLGCPHSPAGCCYRLRATGLHGPVGRGALPTLGLSSAGVQASGCLLFPRSRKTCSSQVGSLTLPADSLGVSVCARASTETLHSSCTGIFSSIRGAFQHPLRLLCPHAAGTGQQRLSPAPGCLLLG